jgi:hypothetical protein
MPLRILFAPPVKIIQYYQMETVNALLDISFQVNIIMYALLAVIAFVNSAL